MAVGVLALRALGLGDLLTVVPALRALRRAHPGDRVVLAAPAALAPLAALTGAVDAVLPTAGLTGRLDPTGWLVPTGGSAGGIGRPALAVNLHGRGPESNRLLRATAPARLWAFHPAGGDAPGPRAGAGPAGRDAPGPGAGGGPDAGGPPWRDGEHEVVRWCRLLGWYGVPAYPADLALRVPDRPSPAPGAVVLHPGAASGSRRWPVDRYAAVAAALRADGHRVVATAGPAERELAAAVGAEVVQPDLVGLAALVAGAALVVCGDTGVAHLATAYGTPSVLLFGPTPPAEWGPRSGPHTVLWRGGRGDPHGAHPDPGLLSIGVQDVLHSARGRVRAAVAP